VEPFAFAIRTSPRSMAKSSSVTTSFNAHTDNFCYNGYDRYMVI
jgi:hypothetical protein